MKKLILFLLLFGASASFAYPSTAKAAEGPSDYATYTLTPRTKKVLAEEAAAEGKRGPRDFKATIQPSVQLPGDRVFPIRKFGAKCDGTTNDTPAIIKAVQALNANGGKGRLVWCSGTTLLTPGNPTSDTTNYMTLSDTTYFMFNITGDNSTVELQPDTHIKVVTSYLCQNAASQFSSCYQVLFGSTANPNKGFRLEGNGAKITFATDTENLSGSSATRVAVLAGNNGFWFFRGKFRDMIQRDYITQNFPANMALDDGYTSGGNVFTDSSFYNIRWEEYGGAGHDSNSYFQGGNVVEDVYISTSRLYHSHSFYFGGGKPNNKLKRIKIAWTGPHSSISNKYAIQSYSEGANADITDITVEDFEFTGMIAGMLFQHANSSNGVTGKVVRRIKLINGYMSGDGTNIGIAATDCNDCEFRGLRMENWSGAIQLANASGGSTTGLNTIISGCNFKTVGGAVSSASNQASLTFENNTLTSPTGSGYLVISQGKSARIVRDHFINCAGSSRVLMNVSGDDLLLDGIEIRDSSNYGGQIIYLPSGVGWKMVNLTVSTGNGGYIEVHGSDFTVSNSTINQRFIVFADASGNNNFIGNTLNGTAGKLEARGAVNVRNNVMPNGPYVASGSDSAGWKNGTNNTFDTSEKVDTVAASGSSFTPHTGIFRNFVYTLTGNATINASEFTPTDGRPINVTLIQNGTGGWTTTFNSQYVVNCSTLNTDTSANRKATLQFVYNATLAKFLQVGACVTNLN